MMTPEPTVSAGAMLSHQSAKRVALIWLENLHDLALG
jgi:hypothetical protein